ncbi:hypothetical protein ACFSCX_12215 [Bacillus salitolerans]|uniref:Spore coat protein n=1 Tax=Bacillus salitolerans TaxID=1437434 RepID=A0ABW4LRD2_9BACI
MFPWGNQENYKDYIKQLVNMKPQDIEGFVNNVMADHFPFSTDRPTNYKHQPPQKENKTTSSNNKEILTKIFEAHEEIYVHFYIDEKEDLLGGKIIYNSNQLTLKNVPEVGDQHQVLLPAVVKQKGAKLQYRDGILQIKLQKANDLQLTEIDLNI